METRPNNDMTEDLLYYKKECGRLCQLLTERDAKIKELKKELKKARCEATNRINQAFFAEQKELWLEIRLARDLAESHRAVLRWITWGVQQGYDIEWATGKALAEMKKHYPQEYL